MGALFLIPFTPLVALADTPHIRSEVDTSRCAACHSSHAAGAQPLLRRISVAGEPVNACVACHDGSDPEAANITTGTPDSFSLASGHSLTEPTAGSAKIEGCATCHYTHGSVADDGRMLPAKTINGVSVTSAGPQLCLACHDAGNSWFGPGYPSTASPTRNAAGYPVSGTWTGPATYASSTNAHRLLPETTVTVGAGTPQPREQGDCRYCHASHRGGNTYDSLLSTFTVPTDATLSADKADGSYADLCFECHGGVKPAGFATAPTDIESFATSSSPSAGHTIVTSGGLLPVGSPLPCFECHNPHGSNRGNSRLISDERGASLETSTSTGVRRFCFTCHTTSGTATGWDSAAGDYATVSSAEQVVGIARDGGVLHLSARDGHAQGDSASCYECHGNAYTVGGSNVHNPGSSGLEAPVGVAAIASDTVAPVTTADLTAAPAGIISLVATDTGVGVDVTYFTLDGGDLSVGTQVLAATEGTHTVQYWSTDTAANVETTNTAIFYVDRTAPLTTSDALPSYAGTATIGLSAADEAGGSGVAATWFRMDGGVDTTGSVVITDAIGAHTLEFWSVDNAGNVEATQTATFTVTDALVMLEPFGLSPARFSAPPSETLLAVSVIAGRRPPIGFAGVAARPGFTDFS